MKSSTRLHTSSKTTEEGRPLSGIKREAQGSVLIELFMSSWAIPTCAHVHDPQQHVKSTRAELR